MKKLLLAAIIAFTFASCTQDDGSETIHEGPDHPQQELTCDCYYFQVVTPQIYFKKYYCGGPIEQFPGTPPSQNEWICP